MLPIAYLYAPIPVCGALIAIFSLEQMVNGVRKGFVRDEAAMQKPMQEAL
jgi:TRAP-type C4-dicarboxylate transport system permease small subunit